MIYQFRFWKEWLDEHGRMWAEPTVVDSVGDARAAHKAALSWHWAHNLLAPSVSDLYSISFSEDVSTGAKREENRTCIATGGKREYHEAALSGVRPSGERDTVPTAPAPLRKAAAKDGFNTPF